jgi:predicted nucleic acid-binding protein
LSRFVLDASVALCWCLENQATSYTEGIFQMMADGAEAYVPFIWPLEMANVLTLAERRKALTIAQTTSFLRALQQWPINVDSAGLDRVFHQILAATRTHKLSAYDAAYLELALREALPLATLDKDLRTAARSAGVKIAGINPVV